MTRVLLDVGAREAGRATTLTEACRHMQWAAKAVDAALPLVPSEEDQPVYDNWHRDRVHMRGIAFRYALDVMEAGGASPAGELDDIWHGRIPPVRE
jgi:hypothetical protein